MWAFKILSWFGIGQKTNQSRAMDLIFVSVMLLTYFDTLFLYFLAVKINGYELKWALERILSVTCSILLMLSINRNRHEFAAAIRKAKFITNTKSEKKLNVLAGCILASPFIYSLVLLLACEIGKDELGFHYFFYGIPVKNKILKYFILYCKSFLYYFLFPTYSNFVVLIFCASCHTSKMFIRNLCEELERCPAKAFTTSIQIRCLNCRRKIYKMLDILQESFYFISFVACAGNFSYCFALLTQLMLYSFSESALTYQADTVINSINVTVPLFMMFWIPEEIQMELEKLNKIILWKYEMRASSGMVSENPSIEKLLLEEKPFVISGCSLIAFQRCHILSVFGTALTYGLLILSFEVRN
ncbi:hypothetical protein AVEN_247496-1 [Araneus ventricosus]|uniref:Gustatory receptor n=1 Tax=Araneus ventricosus TaxID=182803 RepID=A0A4Y2NLB4_ARAVE|nr:hypothetical protein AVEN_247496-1 [Araneus ventricosus]